MSCSQCTSCFSSGLTVCSFCGTTLADFPVVTTLAGGSLFVLANDTLVSLTTLRNDLNLTVSQGDVDFPDGTIPKYIDNIEVASALLEGDDSIVSSKTLELPESSLDLGKSVSLHNQGAQPAFTGAGEEFYLIRNAVDTTSSSPPTYYQLGAETLTAIQAVESFQTTAISIQYELNITGTTAAWRFNNYQLKSGANTDVSGVRIVISLNAVPNAQQTNIVWKSHDDTEWLAGAGYTLTANGVTSTLDTRGVTLETDSTYFVTVEVPASSGDSITLLGNNTGTFEAYQFTLAQIGTVETLLATADLDDTIYTTDGDIATGVTRTVTIVDELANLNFVAPLISWGMINDTLTVTSSDAGTKGAVLSVSGDSLSLLSKIDGSIHQSLSLSSSGLVTQTLFEDTNTLPTGIEYAGDYSDNFSLRSLVDREFVDNQFIFKNPVYFNDSTTNTTANLGVSGYYACDGVGSGITFIISQSDISNASTTNIWDFEIHDFTGDGDNNITVTTEELTVDQFVVTGTDVVFTVTGHPYVMDSIVFIDGPSTDYDDVRGAHVVDSITTNTFTVTISPAITAGTTLTDGTANLALQNLKSLTFQADYGVQRWRIDGLNIF